MQVRVKPKSDCNSNPITLVSSVFYPDALCFPPYDPNNLDERAPITGVLTGQIYQWEPERASLFGSYTYWSSWPSYGNGGYGVNLDPRNHSETLRKAPVSPWPRVPRRFC
eukprot:tig00000139_g8299.t1